MRRYVLLPCACALGAAAVSCVRVALAHSLAVGSTTPLVARLATDAALGVLLALLAVWYLRRQEDPKESLDASFAASLLVSTCAAFALPLTSNDAFSNLAYGRIAALGHDPYLVGPSVLDPSDPFAALVSARWRDTPIVYGPILTTLDAVVGHLHLGVAASLAAFKALMLGATIATIVLAHRYCRGSNGARGAGAFVLVGFCPAIVWELSAQAHNDAVMVLGLTAFVVAAARGRETSAVLALARAVCAKAAAAPVLLLYLVVIARRSPARALLLLTASVVLGAILIMPWWQGWDTLRGPLQTVGGDAGRTSRSFADLLYWCAWPAGPGAQRLVYRVCWLVGLGLLALIGFKSLRRVRVFDDVVRWSLLLFLVYDLLAAPWFQPWYVTWLLPLAMAERDARWQRLVAVYTAITPVQYVLAIDPVNTVAIDVFVLWRGTSLFREVFSRPA